MSSVLFSLLMLARNFGPLLGSQVKNYVYNIHHRLYRAYSQIKLRKNNKLTLGPGLDSKILLAAFIIVFYGAYSQAKTKQNLRQKFSLQQLAATCNLTFFAAVNLLLT